MTKTRKAKLGLLGLMFELYDRWPDLKPMMAQFVAELVNTLSPFAELDFPGICSTREQVDNAITHFESDGKDLIVIVLLTYAPSHIALPALTRTQLPLLIFNTQQLPGVTLNTSSMDTTKNHGMHGVQDLANVLLRAGRKFHIVTGHYKDERTVAEVKSWCNAARTVGFLRHMRVGLLGYPTSGAVQW